MEQPRVLQLPLRRASEEALHKSEAGERPDPVRVGVHDASRVEWVVTLPLRPKDYAFELEFEMEIPANLISPDDVWAHLQEMARLHSPDTTEFAGLSGDDDLRRSTLAVTHRLKILQDQFGRTCMIANSLLLQAPHPDAREELERVLKEALTLVEGARTKLAAASGSSASAAEARLADEFLSGKLLDFLSEIDKDVSGTLITERARFRDAYEVAGAALRRQVTSEITAEICRREEKGFLNPQPDNPDALEDYLERASHLKKHFQEVLFLEMSTTAVENRVRNVVGVFAAVLAAIFYVLALAGPTQFTATGIGLGTTALITAVAYAVKDRLKEISRGWLLHRITNLYGTRSVALRVPSRLLPDRPLLVVSRDIFRVDYENRHDRLNPEVGATHRVAVFRYRKRGKIQQVPTTAEALEKMGLKSAKLIFRFDLSGVFPRLDDPVKRVPVLSKEKNEVRWVDAPRTYHFPVTSKLTTPAGTNRQSGEIVAQKSGILRYDM